MHKIPIHLAQSLPFSQEMTLLDASLLYFAIGAPIGVYYYYEKRNLKNTGYLWLKTFLTYVFWVWFAFDIAFVKLGKSLKSTQRLSRNDDTITTTEREILILRKEIESLIINSKAKGSIYEFRESIERYTGLTLAVQNVESITLSNENGNSGHFVYGFADNPISQACHFRRNNNLLNCHRNRARAEFCEFFAGLDVEDSTIKLLARTSIRFVEALNDGDAKNLLIRSFESNAQIPSADSVLCSERELWNSEKHKQSTDLKLLNNIQSHPKRSF